MIARVSVLFECERCTNPQELRHPTYDVRDMRRRLRILGWRVQINGNRDLCPRCAAEYAKEIRLKGAAQERERSRKRREKP